MIKSERTVTLLIIFKRCSSREVEIKTEPIQEERNREQREGPPKPPTAIHISSTVQGERERKLRPALVQKVVVFARFNPWIPDQRLNNQRETNSYRS